MIGNITIRERGVIGRGLRSGFRKASKEAWHATGRHFHLHMRDRRFSREHGKKAGYQPRQGETVGLTRAEFFRSYTGRKLRRYHHMRPLELTGETRRLIRSATIVSTGRSAAGRGGGVKVRYPGARKFNFRRTARSPNMREEFTRLLPDEVQALVRVYDDTLDERLHRDSTHSTRTI